jgi:hypothetical protein
VSFANRNGPHDKSLIYLEIYGRNASTNEAQTLPLTAFVSSESDDRAALRHASVR